MTWAEHITPGLSDNTERTRIWRTLNKEPLETPQPCCIGNDSIRCTRLALSTNQVGAVINPDPANPSYNLPFRPSPAGIASVLG
ncbi:hypothetical protein VTI28DRAFT_1182 [Corynascus sepedonium]